MPGYGLLTNPHFKTKKAKKKKKKRGWKINK